jgi:general transcription factor 3C polypeptide 5 (transcription factor C subunit 1)
MVIDVKDPMVVDRILSQPPMPTCDINGSGWYGNVAWGLARAILRAKITYIVENSTPYLYEEDLTPLFKLPTYLGPDEDVGKISVTDNPRCVQICSDVRGTVRGAPTRKPTEKRDDGADASLSAGDQGRKRVRWQDEEGEGELGAEFDDDQPEIEEEDEEQEPEELMQEE